MPPAPRVLAGKQNQQEKTDESFAAAYRTPISEIPVPYPMPVGLCHYSIEKRGLLCVLGQVNFGGLRQNSIMVPSGKVYFAVWVKVCSISFF